MKLTESKLREIIREELNSLNESTETVNEVEDQSKNVTLRAYIMIKKKQHTVGYIYVRSEHIGVAYDIDGSNVTLLEPGVKLLKKVTGLSAASLSVFGLGKVKPEEVLFELSPEYKREKSRDSFEKAEQQARASKNIANALSSAMLR